MNNYKFRIWEPLNKTMHYCDFLLSQLSSGNLIVPDGKSLHNKYTVMNLNAVVVQQWSGWYDSNNTEIYQGDLIEDLVVSNRDGYGLGEVICDIKRGVWKVKYYNEETNFTIYKYFLDFLDREKEVITVVGNIFEGVKVE
jgi:hypothetical protein